MDWDATHIKIKKFMDDYGPMLAEMKPEWEAYRKPGNPASEPKRYEGGGAGGADQQQSPAEPFTGGTAAPSEAGGAAGPESSQQPPQAKQEPSDGDGARRGEGASGDS